MMDAYQSIVGRRSVRNFKPDPIPLEVIEKIVEAGRLAPTGANRQPLRFLAIADPEKRAAVFARTAWAAYTRPQGTPPPGNEPTAYVVILVDDSMEAKTAAHDVGFAAAQMLLAGLCFNVAGCALHSFGKDQVAADYDLPGNLRPDTLLALGYPNEFPTFVDRSDTVKYWRDETGRQIVPKRPLSEVLFVDQGPGQG